MLNLPPNFSTVITPWSVEKPRSGCVLDGDAAAVVLDGDRAVVVDRHRDLRGVAGHRLVDRVVDHFVDQVVQAAGGRCRRCTCRPLADVLQVAQVLQLVGAVLGLDLVVLEELAPAFRPACCPGQETGPSGGCLDVGLVVSSGISTQVLAGFGFDLRLLAVRSGDRQDSQEIRLFLQTSILVVRTAAVTPSFGGWPGPGGPVSHACPGVGFRQEMNHHYTDVTDIGGRTRLLSFFIYAIRAHFHG